MGAFADLQTELVALVEAQTGLTRHKGKLDGSTIPAQSLGGGFTCMFTAGADTEKMRNRANVRDSHECEVVLAFLADHNDPLTTTVTALDDVIGIRNALYSVPAVGTYPNLANAVVPSFAYSVEAVAGGEVIQAQINLTLEHTTTVS